MELPADFLSLGRGSVTGTALSQSPGIPVSGGNLVSHAQAVDISNISSALAD